MAYKDNTRELLNEMRKLMYEEVGEQDAIVITDDPKFGQQTLTQQENEFKSSVDNSAEFNFNADPNAPAQDALVYYPSSGDLKFSGKIRNLYWQFSLKDTSGSGCYIYVDGFQLTDDNMGILNKLQGYYKNWCDYWNAENRLISMFGNNNNQ